MTDESDADLIARVNAAHEAQSGVDRLWGWFSCSRASFLVLPRILMCDMPDHWQKRMAILLEEYESAYPTQPDVTTRVLAVRDGRFVKWPAWLLNYRRPNADEIANCRVRR